MCNHELTRRAVVIATLASDVTLIRDVSGGYSLLSPSTSTDLAIALNDFGEMGLDLVKGLLNQRILQEELPKLHKAIKQEQGLRGVVKWLGLWRQLVACGWMEYRLVMGDNPMAILHPLSRLFHFDEVEINEEQPYILSRFAYLRRVGSDLILESSTGQAKMSLLHEEAANAVTLLSKPHTLRALCKRLPAFPAQTLKQLLILLLNCHAITPINDRGHSEPEDAPRKHGESNRALLTWEFHDLLFHKSSRMGRNQESFGGTFPFIGKIDALPPHPEPRSQECITLYKPNIESLIEKDTSFTKVMEERHSARLHGQQPIQLKELGEFLYRSARVRKVIEKQAVTDAGSASYMFTNRVYPNAGACYELDLYLSVSACKGLTAGFYYYDPQDHQLQKISGLSRGVESLLDDARASAAASKPFPHILITYAARFQRVTWKYRGMAYAAILKNVGVLQQTMYLVAEAMQLAGCALGSGNSELFAQVLAEDAYHTGSVGEFALGCPPQSKI